MAVKKGDKIKVEYTGKFESGEVFDSSEKHKEPLTFQVGSGQLIKGFDEAVIGMEVGEEKEVTLNPEDAYGPRNEQLVQKVPKEKLPEGAKEGATLVVNLPNGQQIPARIVSIDDDSATLDLNHPLAGKKLVFKIKVLSIE
ncbi:peptidylprolyl isomerase [Candidatus Woesearchaeota archaeon]|nr:MAG: peptidylprolyl isomerase [Candidatus Woesearchaeota archaeon]